MKTIPFKDHVKLYVAGGNGGNGVATFRREKYVPRGGPDGGDGGRGGDVFFCADLQVDSLLALYYAPRQRAENGTHGRKKRCHGRNGADLTIKVPCGTIVVEEERGACLGELVHHEERLRVARGGEGGKGNCHFITPSHRAPTECTPGIPGEEKTLLLDLSMVADVGLVGYPNAGKSTLLSKLSRAHPKIASYPFTTLCPVIGTLTFNNYRTLRVADIPGLIEGAHKGMGLGDHFLRHIARTRFLLFVMDMGGVDGREPVEDYRHLQRELRLYREDLVERPALVVANKMDLPEASQHLRTFTEKTGIQPLRISAEKKEGIDELKQCLYERLLSGEHR